MYCQKKQKKVHQVAIFIVETLLASQAVLAHTNYNMQGLSKLSATDGT
jgi:hypothetical protein